MTTLTPDSVANQPGWIYSEPGVPHRHSVRTVRAGLPIVYYVGGTRIGLKGVENDFDFRKWMWPATPPTGEKTFSSEHFIDLSRVELVNVDYPARTIAMNQSIKNGDETLSALIRRLPNDFIPFGISQGGSVISQVYDHLRTGPLKDRRKGMLGAATWGNTRHEQGHTFTDPTYGLWPDPAPTKSGQWVPNLKGTESLWHEHYDGDDTTACCENDPNGPHYKRDVWIRRLFDIIMQRYITLLEFAKPAEWVYAFRAYQEINNNIYTSNPDELSPHHRLWTSKPFEAQGDTRTHADIICDYLNSFGVENYKGQRHTFLDQRYEVGEGQRVSISGDVWWINVNTTGLALSLGLNTYDAQDKLTESFPVSYVVKPQRYQYDPVALNGTNLETPPGTKYARIVCDVSPRAMDSGIVWFANPVLSQ